VAKAREKESVPVYCTNTCGKGETAGDIGISARSHLAIKAHETEQEERSVVAEMSGKTQKRGPTYMPLGTESSRNKDKVVKWA